MKSNKSVQLTKNQKLIKKNQSKNETFNEPSKGKVLDELFKIAKKRIDGIKKRKEIDEKQNQYNLIQKKIKNKKINETKREKLDKVKPLYFDQNEGLSIYSETDLMIGQGGYTKDCPFDCDCCF